VNYFLYYLLHLSPARSFIRVYNNMNAKGRYMAKTTVAGLPVIGDLYRSYDNMRYMEDYLENRGLSWDDIKYPTRTQGLQGVGSVLSYVSRNVERLYR
jgi:hypothetical protein